MKDSTEKETKYNLWNPPPKRKRKTLFSGMTLEEKEKALENLDGIVQNIDWDKVNRNLEERLAPYIGNSAIWCRIDLGGFWLRC